MDEIIAYQQHLLALHPDPGQDHKVKEEEEEEMERFSGHCSLAKFICTFSRPTLAQSGPYIF